MSDQTIFQGQGTPADPNVQGGAATPPVVQPDNAYADLLGSIKNERGEPKYKDVQTALDALKHSQEFIPNLKNENEALKAELERAKQEAARIRELEETITRITSGQPPKQDTPVDKGLDAEAIAKLVSQTLERTEKEKTAKQNQSTVTAKLVEKFGAEAEKVFYGKARELGLSVEQINSMAAQSPQAVFKLYGIEEKQTPQVVTTPSSSGINTSGFQPQKESNLGRNTKPVILGATTEDLKVENQNARALVEELHQNGLTTYDLTDPKQYFKYFNQGK